jgi:hypothetical protein
MDSTSQYSNLKKRERERERERIDGTYIPAEATAYTVYGRRGRAGQRRC